MTDLLIKWFVKNHQDVENPRVREEYGKFAGIVGIGTNFLLFLIKITVGTLFNSISITADAVNNLSDSGSSVVTVVGFKIAGKPADAKHPFGHARMEYISGLIVSFVILLLGVQLIQSSAGKILHPQTARFSWLTILVLAIAILLKLWQCLFYRTVGRRIHSTALTATSMDSRNDILATSSVLAAALITKWTGFNLDGYMGVVVALFILASGIRLVMDTASPLLGNAPSEELVGKIYKKILGYEGIIGLHDLNVHNYGVATCFASVHCEVCAEQDIMVSHDIIDNIERDFLKDMGIHMVIHLDPVVTEDERANELKEAVRGLIAGLSPEIGMHDFRMVRGITHSNLIFDIVTPYGFSLSDEELVRRITDEIHKMDPNLHAVITVDHDSVTDRIHLQG
jgi:cation diffusion facilitator family transporter